LKLACLLDYFFLMSPKGKEKEKTITSINQQLFAHSTHRVFFNVKHSQARESGFK
jgi:hypothetical protein